MNDERGQTATPRTLKQEIADYIRGAGGLEMPDVRASAKACQQRIDAMGYRWDYARMLWRAPERNLCKTRK